MCSGSFHQIKTVQLYYSTTARNQIFPNIYFEILNMPRAILKTPSTRILRVTLCIKKKGNRKSSCFEIFHQIGDLTSLKGKTDSNSPTPVNLSALRKRKVGSQIKK